MYQRFLVIFSVILGLLVSNCSHSKSNNSLKALALLQLLNGSSVWTQTSLNSQNSPQGINNLIFANNKFIAFDSSSGSINASSDGVNWNKNVLTYNYFNSASNALAADSSTYYLGTGGTTGGKFFYSTDGQSWTDASFTATYTRVYIKDFATDGTTYIAVGGADNGTTTVGAIFYTTTPKTASSWTVKTYSSVTSIDFVTNIGSKFYVTTTDGKTDSCTSSCSSGNFSGTLTTVSSLSSVTQLETFNNTIFAMTGSVVKNTNQLYSTTDFSNFSNLASTNSNKISGIAISSSLNKIIGLAAQVDSSIQAVINGGTVYSSTDGNSWTALTQSPGNTIKYLSAASDGKVIIIGGVGSNSDAVAEASVSSVGL